MATHERRNKVIRASWHTTVVTLLTAALWVGCTDTGSAVGDQNGGGGFTATDTVGTADGSVPLLDGSMTPIDGDVTYYSHVKAILEAHCVACHTPGEVAPFVLGTYSTAYAVREAIAAEVGAGRMPPWLADGDCETYSPDGSLTEIERETLLVWVSGGAPEGYPANYVPPFVDPPTTLTGTTIPVMMAEPYTPPAGTTDIRCIPITWPGATTLYVTGAQIVPGVRTEVHHVIAYATGPSLGPALAAADQAHEGPGYPCFGSLLPSEGDAIGADVSALGWLSSWRPGDAAKLLPTSTGIRIEPGSTIVLQVHYDTQTVEPTPDVTMAYFQVAQSVELPAALYPFTNFSWVFSDNAMAIPAGESGVTHGHSDDITGWQNYFSVELNRAMTDPLMIHSVAVHMHRLGTNASITLRRSNGAEDCLLDIPNWDLDWQESYRFAQPMIFNPGDVIELSCTWDNSQANQPWVNGFQATPQDVFWGAGDQDEMCLGLLLVSALDSTPGVCTPNCNQKQCGSDGCGGTCGDCPVEAPYCDPATYQCTAQCLPNCNLKECGDDGCGGSCGDCPVTAPNCDPTNHQCTAMCIPTCGDVQCGSDGCGGNCGVCPTNTPYCIEGICYADAEGTCLPACDDKNCGANGCGGNCGLCPPHAPTCTNGICGGICQANCTGKQCGDDGCGSTCGECPEWAPSCVDYFCVDDCVPDCLGKQCGDDGCGAVCGFCPATAACIDGDCKLGCDNPCDGKQCGEDGCGGSCGVCGGTFVCQNSICIDPAGCNPNCLGKQCGDNGCGGTCGTCIGNTTCQNGVCTSGGCTPDCWQKQCGPNGCGGSCGNCVGNTSCLNGVCVGGGCSPKCANKECGPDSCGGTCGYCPGGTICNGAGLCEQDTGGGPGNGDCTNAADQAILQTIDAQTMATECGLGCIGDINPSACATSCLQAQSGLSSPCSACFGNLVGCIIGYCLTDCINPEAIECTTCTQSHCGSQFTSCSGLQLNN